MAGEADIRERLQGKDFLARPLDRRAIWEWQQHWREIYARGLKDATGKWVPDGLDWHSFAGDYTESRSGFAAEREYMSVEPTDFIVVSGWSRKQFGFEATGQPPDLNLGVDVLVFPCTLEWTMAYTHEDDHGPFFARSEPNALP